MLVKLAADAAYQAAGAADPSTEGRSRLRALRSSLLVAFDGM
jgi:hypothetical protein